MVGIRGLEYFIKQRDLAQTAPLSALANTRLGIDAKQYINSLLNSPDSREPFVTATGGIPLSITQRIENDLSTLNRNRIKPIFVFPGLHPASIQPIKGLTLQDGRDDYLKGEAWRLYEEGMVNDAIHAFAQVKGGGSKDYREVLRLVIRVLKQKMVEYVVAPYLEQSQLAYLLNHPKGYIHAIYSSNEALLWPVDKVITSIDFPSSFTFIDKSRLLRDLQLSPDHFLDVGIIAGCSICRTIPIFSEHFALAQIIDLIRQYRTGVTAIDQLSHHDPPQMTAYRQEYVRTRQAIRHGFIYTTEGVCRPLPLAMANPQLTEADVPWDMDSILSPKLPDELYYYMCKGMISPTVLGWLTTGSIHEPVPLSDSEDYQRYVKKTITETVASPRVLCLAILLDALHPQWKERRVNATYYFDPASAGSALSLDKPKTLELVKTLSSWAVPCSVLQQELRRQSMSTIDIKLCIGTISDLSMAKTTLQPYSKPLERKDEFVSNAIWRYLTIRGFISGTDHTLTMAGQGLHAALNQCRGNDRIQESLTTIIELLRCGVLHGFSIGEGYQSGGPVGEDEQDKSSSMLILRCLSVLPLLFRNQQWAGPLSRELLVFNSFSRSIQRCSRQLLEAISVHMLLKGSAKRQRDDYVELLLSLPFQTETNTGFGILFKTYLDVTLYQYQNAESVLELGNENITITSDTANSPEAKSAKEDAMEFVEQNFPSVKLPRQEIERGFRFWDAVMVAVRVMAELQLQVKEDDLEKQQTRVLTDAKQTLEEFETADRWLQPMRP